MSGNKQSDKPTWVEPEVIQIDQLPTTFGACAKGKSETPSSPSCGVGKSAAPTCNKGARGNKP